MPLYGELQNVGFFHSDYKCTPTQTSKTVRKRNLLKLNASTVNVIFVEHFDFNKAAFSGG